MKISPINLKIKLLDPIPKKVLSKFEETFERNFDNQIEKK